QGTTPFAVNVTYTRTGATPADTTSYTQTLTLDPSTLAAGVILNSHVALLNAPAGQFTAHLAGNQPLPEWLDFDASTMTLSRSDFAPAANAPNARVDIVFAPNPVTLPDGRIAASTGAFTLEFLVNPNAPLDPKIDALLAN